MTRVLLFLRLHVPLLAGAIALAACNQDSILQPTLSGKGGDETGVEKNFSLLTDIPIPPKSKLDVDRSLILGDLDRWTGRIVLNVGDNTTQIFALYQTQMSDFGWEPVMSVQSDISVLTFIRGERAATVQIEKRALGGGTTIITVAPRQSGPPPGTGSNAPAQIRPAR